LEGKGFANWLGVTVGPAKRYVRALRTGEGELGMAMVVEMEVVEVVEVIEVEIEKEGITPLLIYLRDGP
jgi:hypothetical protein